MSFLDADEALREWGAQKLEVKDPTWGRVPAFSRALRPIFNNRHSTYSNA